jgi:hypothetical protein
MVPHGDKAVGKQEPFYIANGSANWYNPCGGQFSSIYPIVIQASYATYLT